MFVISFDMSVAELVAHHPRGSRQGYADIATVLEKHGFSRVQWSVSAASNEDLVALIGAVTALQGLPWFHRAVKNIRAFRMEAGADLTSLFAQTAAVAA
jgi:virulence-associated protein VapD